MIKRASIALLAAALSGCASLNVSWSFTASYNTTTQAASVVRHDAER